MKREPMGQALIIVELVMAFVSMILAFGYISWTDQQLNTFEVFIGLFITALVAGVGQYLMSRPKVTPVADPRDNEGNRLVPEE